MEHIYDTVIIGSGAAGCTAALYASRAGLDTLMIEKMAPGGQMALTDIIDNYSGFDEGIDGFTLGMKMHQQAERFGTKTEYADVNDVDFSKDIKVIKTDIGDFYGKTVIIASGANPRELGIKGEQELLGRGVHYCAHCDGNFYKDKIAVVVGGGNSAVSDALYLSHIAKKVIMVHRRDTLRATRIYHEPLMACENIEFLWDSALDEIIGDDKVAKVTVKNLKNNEITEIPCDGVFVSIGRKPATDYLAGKIDLDENGYIIAGETTKTNIDGVFAAGDIRTKALRQIITAAADGAIASHFAEEYLSIH